MESRVTGKRILVKYYDGNIDVYQKLLGKTLPNIPTVYNAVCEDGKCIVVEDYIDGITIGEMLEVGRYSSKEVEKIILEMCDARSAGLFFNLDSSIRPIWRQQNDLHSQKYHCRKP